MQANLSDSWIVEGNYNQVIEAFSKDSDLVIFLQFSKWFSLYNVIKRRVLSPKFEKGFGVGKIHKLPWHFIKFILFVYPEVSSKQYELIERLEPKALKRIETFRKFLEFQDKELDV